MKLAAALLLVSACGASVSASRVVGPDGTRNWFAITCRESAGCYNEAGFICPGGYDTAGHESGLLVKCHGEARWRDCNDDSDCPGQRCQSGDDVGHCIEK